MGRLLRKQLAGVTVAGVAVLAVPSTASAEPDPLLDLGAGVNLDAGVANLELAVRAVVPDPPPIVEPPPPPEPPPDEPPPTEPPPPTDPPPEEPPPGDEPGEPGEPGPGGPGKIVPETPPLDETPTPAGDATGTAMPASGAAGTDAAAAIPDMPNYVG